MARVLSVEQSVENTIPTEGTTFKPKDLYDDLQEAIRKIKSSDDKASKQSSAEAEVFSSFGELLHMNPK